MKELLTESGDDKSSGVAMSAFAGEHNPDLCWSSDTEHYRPLLIHLVWHCFGSYRATDGDGGCSVGSLAIRSRAQLSRQHEHQLDCPSRRDDSHSTRKARYTPKMFSKLPVLVVPNTCPQIVLEETRTG